jgi:FlaA1/EpsC-like NDP-sugar epimerase
MTLAGTGFFRDATVLVTGGTGSIGSAIVEALLADGPAAVRVLSRDDSKQFELA